MGSATPSQVGDRPISRLDRGLELQLGRQAALAVERVRHLGDQPPVASISGLKPRPVPLRSG